MTFYEAWHYLYKHPMFQDCFQECLDIEVVKINPETKCVDDNETLNTATEIWLECGPYYDSMGTHDIDLDCGGATFEEAIIKLAQLVKKYYPNKKKQFRE